MVSEADAATVDQQRDPGDLGPIHTEFRLGSVV